MVIFNTLVVFVTTGPATCLVLCSVLKGIVYSQVKVNLLILVVI